MIINVISGTVFEKGNYKLNGKYFTKRRTQRTI